MNDSNPVTWLLEVAGSLLVLAVSVNELDGVTADDETAKLIRGLVEDMPTELKRAGTIYALQNIAEVDSTVADAVDSAIQTVGGVK